jgi:hypothetical protein
MRSSDRLPPRNVRRRRAPPPRASAGAGTIAMANAVTNGSIFDLALIMTNRTPTNLVIGESDLPVGQGSVA